MNFKKSPYKADIQALLLDSSLTPEEKLEMLQLKVSYALKNLTGRKKYQFLVTLLILLMFFLGHNTPAFTMFMAYIRELLKFNKDEDLIGEYLIDVYYEYNAPLPNELVDFITKIG